MRAATLTLLTLLGLAAGVFYGQYVLFDPLNLIDRNHWTFVAGDLALIRPLTLLTLPLVIVGAISAAATMKAVSRFGLVFASTLAWFAVTMILAAVLGTAAATFMRPGELAPDVRENLISHAAARFDANIDVSRGVQGLVSTGQESLTGAWLAVLRRALPDNLVADVAAGRLLGLVVLALLLGLGLAAIGERGAPARAVVDGLLAGLLRVARWISWIAPVGVFLLVANAVGSIGLEGLRGMMEQFCLTVVGALAAYAIVVLPFALLVFGRCNPIGYAWRVGRALCAAFATSSSVATLPMAMESAVAGESVRRNGAARRGSACSNAAANLVLPMGAMLNLNGTAIFQAAAVVFLCQAHGIALETSELVVIIITATIAGISTAGLPSAGLVTLIIVITAVNTSLAGRGLAALPVSAIGILVAVDRVLDMCRTTVNVWGNLVGARIVSVIAPDEESEINHRDTEAQRGKRNGIVTPGLTT